MKYYNSAVMTVIGEFVHNKQYPMFENVLRHFLVKFGAPSLQHLGFTQLRSLDILYDIQQKISAFISAYVGTQSVISYCDLEAEICGMLRSFNIPPMGSQSVTDPNELNIDTETNPCGLEQNDNISTSFEQFGMGSLVIHPQIQQMFPYLKTTSTRVTTADVIAQLEEFMTSSCSGLTFNSEHASGLGKEKRTLNISNFRSYLCEQYQVTDLTSVGLLIRGSMEAELLMLRHIQARRDYLLVNMQKQLLDNLNSQYGGNEAYSDTKKRHKNVATGSRSLPSDAPSISTASVNISVRPSSRLETQGLLERFQKKLDSPYAPSFSKTHRLLEELWKQDRGSCRRNNAQHSGEVHSNSNARKRKRKGKEPCNLNSIGVENDDDVLTTLEKELLSVVAEYVMLHVGGSKHRAKHLSVESHSAPGMDSSAGGEVRGSYNSSDDDSSINSISSGSDNSSSDSDSSDSDSSDSSDDNIDQPDSSRTTQALILPTSTPKNNMKTNESSAIIPFEGRLAMGALRCTPGLIETIELSALLPWCRHNTLPHSTNKTELLRSIGRWGESLVYQHLLLQYPNRTVTWLNEQEESNASYDLKLERKGSHFVDTHSSEGEHSDARTIFVEVKTTQFSDKNVFQISKWEWDFITSLPRVQYDIYRVYNAGNAQTVRLAVYHDVFKLVEERKIQLCLAV